MPSNLHESFISLVRLGIGHSVSVQTDVDWNSIETHAERHGLSAVLIDGIEKLPENCRPPKELLLQWIGECLQSYEYRYDSYRRAIAELASFYNTHELKMMIIKGYACGLDWPKPEHRPYGDIDIWQFGKQKEADEALKSFRIQDSSTSEAAKPSAGFKIDSSHHHHTVFEWDGFTVENHYDFVNVHAHRSSAELEKVFKKLGKDETHYVEVHGEKVYLPSPNLHALFMIKHMVSHFAAAEINLRQVLDWAFFVEKHTQEIDWKWLDGMLDKYSMKDFVNCINGICVEDLGFDAGMFQEVKFLPALKEKILNDILNPEYTSAEPEGFVRRCIYKYKRWQGNAWKQRLCYKESRWEYFWSGLWAKMLKP